jgi:transposase
MVVEFREVSDAQWQAIAPYLPAAAGTGRPRVDDRRLVNGIIYVLLSGCRWGDMPSQYGSAKTAWRRHKELQEHGVWDRVLQALRDQGDRAGAVDRQAVALDATTVEAKKGARRLGGTASGGRKGARSTSS